MNSTRRHFLGGTMAAAGLLPRLLDADPLGLPIGCQTYPVRDALCKDFDGTLKQLAGMGYRMIEMCSPPGYANAGYGPLVGMKTSDMKERIHAAGLGCESCHFQWTELRQKTDDRIAFAKELGLKQMVLSTFGFRPDATMAEWVQSAHDLNKIGEQVKKAGMQLGFHNHNFEFKEIDGVLVYDKLMSEFDPKLVKMQFQVSVISLGYEAATYLTKYPGRFLSMHLQDWSSTEKKQVPVGQGMVDWKKTFAAAKTAGIKNYFVELNMDQLKPSIDYLHTLT
ncbi:MAG TPA: TIM barrel protein [Bryobacteraceae bacterium]|nr:TIM barrel protein [Bryobacteraceae bacterium]